MKKFAAYLALTYIALAATAAFAQTPSITIEASKTRRNIQVVITPDTSAAGCTYAIRAAFKKRKLLNNFSASNLVAEGAGSIGASTFNATNLPRLRGRSGLAEVQNVFFAASITCGENQAQSAVSRIRIKRQESGLAPRAWFASLAERFFAQTLQLVDAFPNFEFDSPIEIQNANDGTNRLFIAEQRGVIYVIRNVGGNLIRSSFLDIQNLTNQDGEQGLLGFAFHPDFANNGRFFVNYTDLSGDTVIARYELTGDPNDADEASAAILLTQNQPFSNHNGGALAFGPDGYLYVALGDGGDGGDPQNNGQDRTTLLGKILRLDVDSGALGNYGIPGDNPFVGEGGGVREEIYAYGLRNPWKFSFDSANGRCFVADVGQGSIEEIDILESGGNYGWRLKEGDQCFNPDSNCEDGVTVIDPIAQYSHSVGSSITGGYVYRGSALPTLVGYYIVGDFIEGKIFALKADGLSSELIELFDTDLFISSFGVDEDQELYLASYGDGKIYKFSN